MSEKSFVRRHPGMVALVLIVVALAIPKLLAWRASSAAETPGQTEARVLRVAAHRVAPKQMVELLSTTGTVRANEQVEVVSEIAGKVEHIRFDEGGRVGAGQLLVEINAAELEAERERAAFRVSLAEKREQRQLKLRDEGILSPQEYDLDLNQLNVYRAELALIEARLTKTKIRAPFAGTIGLRRVSEGSYLSPQTSIATLQDLDPVKVDFSLPERYAGQVRVGQEVEFRVKGSAAPRRAKIYAIEPGVDAETRSLILRARSANPDRTLLPGAFADVDLRARVVEGALAVPSIAVIPELGGKKVFVYENGQAQPRAVETGLRTETEVEITRGLQAGDLVLISGLLELRAGLAVEIDEAALREGHSEAPDEADGSASGEAPGQAPVEAPVDAAAARAEP